MMKMKERADVRTAKMMAPATTGSKAAVDKNLSPTLRSNAVNVSASVKLCSAPVNQGEHVLRKLGAMQAQLTNLANSKVLQLPPQPSTRL